MKTDKIVETYQAGDSISAIEAVNNTYEGLDIRPKVFDNLTREWVLLDSGSCVSWGKHQLIYCFCSTVESLFLIYPCLFLIYPCSFLIYPKFNSRSKTNMGRSKTNMGRSETNMGRSETNIGRSKTNMGRSETNMGRSETNMGRSKTNMGRSKTKSAWTHSSFLIYLM